MENLSWLEIKKNRRNVTKEITFDVQIVWANTEEAEVLVQVSHKGEFIGFIGLNGFVSDNKHYSVEGAAWAGYPKVQWFRVFYTP